MDKSNQKLVKFIAVKSGVEAELIKHKLEQKSIPVFIENINASTFHGELPSDICGIEIWIPKKYIPEAEDIIKSK